MKFKGIATSNPMQISFVLNAILQLHPESVLDIGCGSGKYGLLIRENMRQARIEGIEGFDPYVNDIHKTVYDRIYVGNAMDVVHELESSYELVIMIDMFEHLTPQDGRRLLRALEDHSHQILISVPTWHPTQDQIDGNLLQEHHAQYDVSKLRELGFGQIWRVSGSYIALRSSRKVNIRFTALKCAMALILPQWANAMLTPISRKLIGGHHHSC